MPLLCKLLRWHGCCQQDLRPPTLLGLIGRNIRAEALCKVLALLLHVLAHGCGGVDTLLPLDLIVQPGPHEIADAVAITLQAPLCRSYHAAITSRTVSPSQALGLKAKAYSYMQGQLEQ